LSQRRNPKVHRGPGRTKKKKTSKLIIKNQGKKEEGNKVGNSQIKKKLVWIT